MNKFERRLRLWLKWKPSCLDDSGTYMDDTERVGYIILDTLSILNRHYKISGWTTQSAGTSAARGTHYAIYGDSKTKLFAFHKKNTDQRVSLFLWPFKRWGRFLDHKDYYVEYNHLRDIMGDMLTGKDAILGMIYHEYAHALTWRDESADGELAHGATFQKNYKSILMVINGGQEGDIDV